MHDTCARLFFPHPSPLTPYLFRLLMPRVLFAVPAVLAQLEALGRLLPVLRRAVIPALAVDARQSNDVSHKFPARRIASFSIDDLPHLFRDCQSTINSAIANQKSGSASYAMISVIVPAPTVRPPSRMAKREPFSIATGVISSPVMSVLSPGITISTPSGRWSEPVTSVVRM